MRAWSELSMAEKADVMKLAIEGGVYDLDSIRSGYNEYASGGKIHIKPENRGKFTALKKRTGHSATWFKEHGTPAQKKMAVFALNAAKWKHEDGGNLYAHGGELGNYYDGWGDAWNFLKSGVQKARQKVKDWGLDKSPAEHVASRVVTAEKDIIDNRNPELSNTVSNTLNTGRIIGINKYVKGSDEDTNYKQNLYNIIDPTNIIPESALDVAGYAADVVRAKSSNKYPYSRTHIDAAADAAWAKRLGLSYDNNILIDNPDGTVHLSQELENEIPTDTTFIKNRIADNKKLLNSTYGKQRQYINAAINIDNKALSALRQTYSTGKPVEMNEFSYNSRNLRKNSETTPLNLLHRYTIQYDKNNNAMNYWDTYNFDGFEDYVPGNPFKIKGSIKLKSK